MDHHKPLEGSPINQPEFAKICEGGIRKGSLNFDPADVLLTLLTIGMEQAVTSGS